jgi:hypothetical protein
MIGQISALVVTVWAALIYPKEFWLKFQGRHSSF